MIIEAFSHEKFLYVRLLGSFSNLMVGKGTGFFVINYKKVIQPKMVVMIFPESDETTWT